MKWESGRQEATKDIQKLTLWCRWFFDCYLLSIPSGKKIDWHFDKVKDKRHWRFNLTLKGKWIFFRRKKKITQSMLSFHVFRPDLEEHAADVLEECLILSIGWVKS